MTIYFGIYPLLTSVIVVHVCVHKHIYTYVNVFDVMQQSLKH